MLDAFDAAAAEAIVEAAAMDGTAPLISVEVRHLEGALGRPDPNGGVLSHFEAPYVMYSIGMAPCPRIGRPAIAGAHPAIRSAAAPWLSRSAYFNFAERDVDGELPLPGRRLRAACRDPRRRRPGRRLPREARDRLRSGGAGSDRLPALP